jgi:uncharacterized protein (TIGR03790 family)
VQRLLPLALFCSQLAASISPPIARGELIATQVAILATRGNAESEQLAEYYANARKIPVANICLVDLPAGEECPREAWDKSIRPAIVAWLAEHDPERKLRCLTTVYGVPLTIAKAPVSPELRKYHAYLAGERALRLAGLHDTIKQLEAIAPAGAVSTNQIGGGAQPDATTAADPQPETGSPDELAWLQRRIEAALKAAQLRVQDLRQGADRQAAQNRLQQIVTQAGGAVVILQNLQQQMAGQLAANPAIANEFHRLRGAASAWTEARQFFELQPPGIERDASILAIADRVGGAMGAIPWLDEQIAVALRNESAASFDSELALVLWPADYELLGRQPNYLRRAYDQSYLRESFPTLMVSRIDGPTPQLARGLIDAAIATEAEGLKGKAYIDSRGIAQRGDVAARQQAVAADYDRAIVAAGEAFKAVTTVPTEINTGPELFAADACPDAALYCGWYSLGKYVDAFDWKPGAVGFHAGGDEAAALHDPASQRWCKRLIEDGVAATIGATFGDDPAAFPLPTEFFGLLIEGELTFAECVWQTQPAASWSLVAIGDPLYRPFKNLRVQREESVIRDAGR